MKLTISHFEEEYIKNIPDVILTKESFIDLTSNFALKISFKTKKI
jgi:hypothetical protein